MTFAKPTRVVFVRLATHVRAIAWCVAVVWPAVADAAKPLKRSATSGPLTVTVTLDPEQPLIGDTFTLELRVRVEADVEVLMPEFGEALDRFTIVDFVPREQLDGQGRKLATQTYRLQASASGPQIIPPILVEYVDRRSGKKSAPEGFDAYEFLTEQLEFQVQSVIPDDAKLDLKPPLGQLAPLETPSTIRWPWVVGGALALLAITPSAYRAYARYRRRARRRSAYDIAHGRLERLVQKRTSFGDADAFYVVLSDIVRRYLEDRFELRAPELTTEEFLLSVGESPDLSDEHQLLLREFLRLADLVKFAGLQPSADDMARSIEAAQQFLEETRDNAPLIEELPSE